MPKRLEITGKELWKNIQACIPRVLKGDAKFAVQRDMALYWLMVHQVHSHKLDMPRMQEDVNALKKHPPALACATQVFLEQEMDRHKRLYESYERLANEALRRLNRVFNNDHRLKAYRLFVRMTAGRWLALRDGG